MSSQSLVGVFQSARSKFLSGELDLAIDQLQSALECDEDAGNLWELLGQVYYTKGETKKARSALEHAGLLTPLSGCGQFVLARCYESEGPTDISQSIFRHLAALPDLEANLLEPLARALGRTGDFDAALHVCREAARRLPEAPEPLMGMVFYMRRLRRPVEQILPCLFRAHHLDPDDFECRMTLALLLHEIGRSADAANLLAPVPIENCRCGRCLAGMETVFFAAGYHEHAARCTDMIRANSENSR